MATIKSYTDIEQSRQLAEILPLESADMAYYFWENSGNIVTPCPFVLDGTEVKKGGMFTYLNCWSLAALLDVIKEQGNVDLRFLKSTFDNRGNHLTNVWCCTFEDIGPITLDMYAENPVDACVAMIEKLKELNLL